MVKHYFSTDGNYGNAEGLVIIDTTDWSAEVWAYIEGLDEGYRAEVTEDIAAGRGSIDQQDCPEYMDEALTVECGFTGPVYRQFVDPERGEDGGYTWTCPDCETEHEWEGEDDLIASEPTA